MKAVCPKNKRHKLFLTTAHVMQEWVVNAFGEFVRESDLCLEVTAKPDPDNEWICKICGAVAKIKKD